MAAGSMGIGTDCFLKLEPLTEERATTRRYAVVQWTLIDANVSGVALWLLIES